jgi:hypothetical protein
MRRTTAAGLEFARRGATRAIVKGFVVGILGLAMPFASPVDGSPPL